MNKRLNQSLAMLFTLALLVGIAVPAASQTPTDPRFAPIAFNMQLQSAKAKGHAQLDSALNRLVTAQRAAPNGWQIQAQQLGLEVADNRVLVTLTMLDTPAADAAVLAVTKLGGEVTARHERWLDVLLPPDALLQAAGLPGVSVVARPTPVFPLSPSAQEGQPPDGAELFGPWAPADGEPTLLTEGAAAALAPVTTQGVAKSNANAWHAAGLRGAGVTVAVIDSFRFAGDAVAAGELPSTVGVFPPGGTLSTASDHGTSVAEIVYDMAPNAQMVLASPNSSSCISIADYVLGLAQAGVDIISSSIGPLQCGAGDGNPQNDPIASAATQALNTYKTMFFQAAGNHAERHWDGQFKNSAGDLWAEFAPGITVNLLGSGNLPAGYPYSIFLRWNDWPVADQDYDLYLVRYNTQAAEWQVVDASENVQTGSQPPVESLQGLLPSTDLYGIAIYKYDADGKQVLDTMNFYFDLDSGVTDRSLVGPATSPNVFSVAAVDVGSLGLEYYSSHGPTYGAGGALTGGSAQPQLAGFANVTTWVSSQQGKPPFNGTSAATPHVAGAAALVWGANPCLTPQQVRSFLTTRAKDAGAPGYDYLYGSGSLFLGSPTANLCAQQTRTPLFLPVIRR